jgi:hypothetical protein
MYVYLLFYLLPSDKIWMFTLVAPLYYVDILLTIFNIIEPLLFHFVKYLRKSVTMLF